MKTNQLLLFAIISAMTLAVEGFTPSTPHLHGATRPRPIFDHHRLQVATLNEEILLSHRTETVIAGDATAADDDLVVEYQTGTEYVPPSTATKPFKPPALATWKRRLNTKQDAFNLHKVSGVSFLLSGFLIMGNGLTCGFSEVQDYLLVPTYIFAISCLTTSVASSIMAWKYRYNEVAIRNGMIDLAAVTTLTGFMALWSSHFCPSIIADVDWLSKGIVSFLAMLCNIGAVDGIIRGDEMVDNRKEGKNTEARVPYWLDWTRYVLPNFATLFYCTLVFNLFGVQMSHSDYLNLISEGTTTEALGYYNCVMASVFGSCLVFFQTLRDKKLIPKETEAWSILLFSAFEVAHNMYFMPSF